MGKNTWIPLARAKTSPLGQRNSLFIRPTLQVHTNLSPVTWTFPLCQRSALLQRPGTRPCCLWRATNRGLSQPTAGTARFTAPRSSLSLDTCGNPPCQVSFITQCPVFTISHHILVCFHTGGTFFRIGIINISCCVNLDNKQHNRYSCWNIITIIMYGK